MRVTNSLKNVLKGTADSSLPKVSTFKNRYLSEWWGAADAEFGICCWKSCWELQNSHSKVQPSGPQMLLPCIIESSQLTALASDIRHALVFSSIC